MHKPESVQENVTHKILWNSSPWEFYESHWDCSTNLIYTHSLISFRLIPYSHIESQT